MATLRMLTLCISFLAATFMISNRCASEGDSLAANLTVGVADFSGADKQTGRFVADTLLTDLAQSPKLNLVERSEIGKALTELKLQSTGLTEPQQIRKIGRLIGADRLIVGSYLVRDNQLLINARLLDVHTGRVVPGGAANVTGARDGMLSLVHRLAHLFHRRVTGADFSVDAAEPGRLIEDASSKESQPGAAGSDTSHPSYGPAEAAVTEGGLAAFLRRLREDVGPRCFTVQRPGATVTRIRVVVALVRALFPSGGPSASRNTGWTDRLVPDIASVPLWARSFVAAAVRNHLWASDEALHPASKADWGFVRRLVEGTDAGDTPNLAGDRSDGSYTGLVVDAHDLNVERSMSARVLDEDGRLIYPQQGHMPGPDQVDDTGTVSYYRAGREPSRAGNNPLIVRALRIQGDDVIVSAEAAERILAENRRNHFLWRWCVCFLLDDGQ